LKKKRQ